MSDYTPRPLIGWVLPHETHNFRELDLFENRNDLDGLAFKDKLEVALDVLEQDLGGYQYHETTNVRLDVSRVYQRKGYPVDYDLDPSKASGVYGGDDDDVYVFRLEIAVKVDAVERENPLYEMVKAIEHDVKTEAKDRYEREVAERNEEIATLKARLAALGESS